MRGHLSADGRVARVRLGVRSTARDVDPTSADVLAIVDTGFTGYVTLPATVISALSLPQRGVVEAELADGSAVSLRLHVADVLWHGRVRRVLVCQTDADALLGMSLLHGCRLTMDVIPGGAVTISQHDPEGCTALHGV